jgi:hypothetical protein
LGYIMPASRAPTSLLRKEGNGLHFASCMLLASRGPCSQSGIWGVYGLPFIILLVRSMNYDCLKLTNSLFRNFIQAILHELAYCSQTFYPLCNFNSYLFPKFAWLKFLLEDTGKRWGIFGSSCIGKR